MLKEAVPGISCVALVWASLAAPDKEPGVREAERAAHALGLQIQYIEIRKSEDWEAAAMAVLNASPKPDAVFQLCDPVTLSRRKALVDFAARSWLPSMYEMKEYVVEGGLMAYGPSLAAMGRRSAYFVDKILKGRGQAGRPASGAAHQVRAGYQPQDRQGDRSRVAPAAARPRRRGDRVKKAVPPERA
jgi:putative tryptophan/tyrosine transport system substrate-binding protein